MGMIQVIMRIDDHHDGLSRQPLRFLAYAAALVSHGHGVDDDRTLTGSKHTDVSTQAVNHPDIIGQLLDRKVAQLAEYVKPECRLHNRDYQNRLQPTFHNTPGVVVQEVFLHRRGRSVIRP